MEAQQKPCHRGVRVTRPRPPPPRQPAVPLTSCYHDSGPPQRQLLIPQRTKRRTDVGIVMQSAPSSLHLTLLLLHPEWRRRRRRRKTTSDHSDKKKPNRLETNFGLDLTRIETGTKRFWKVRGAGGSSSLQEAGRCFDLLSTSNRFLI